MKIDKKKLLKIKVLKMKIFTETDILFDIKKVLHYYRYWILFNDITIILILYDIK